MPLIYSGQELPNQKRLAFFDKDPIAWQEGVQLHDIYKKLLRLRNSHPALRGGDNAVSTQWISTKTNDPMLAFVRRNGNRSVVVLLNFSPQPQYVDTSSCGLEGRYVELLTNREWHPAEQHSALVLPWAAQVWVDVP